MELPELLEDADEADPADAAPEMRPDRELPEKRPCRVGGGGTQDTVAARMAPTSM